MHSSRRAFLAGGAACGVFAALGQNPGEVQYREYSRCLRDHLRALALEAYRKRTAAIARLTNVDAIHDRQRWVRRTFWNLVGGEPSRTPLNARTTKSFRHDGIRIDCVIFESQPRLYVTANLYVPQSGKPPYPGVLFQPGHSANGKAYELYQLCCLGLAKLGCVVLSIDPMGQGERTYYPGEIGADNEHTIAGKQMLLVGDTATRLQTWDAVRALDYLSGLPFVDAKRLGATGQSGGGTNSMFLAAVDDRIAAAAIACPNTENVAVQDFIPPGSTDDAEQNLIGSGPLGFDRWDLLYPLAPKPLLVLVSAKDFSGTYSPNYIRSGVEEYKRLRAVYGKLGAADRIGWFETPLPHGLSYELRVQIYNWMNRWLLGGTNPITQEPPVSPLPEKRLQASDQPLGGETPASLARQRLPEVPSGKLPLDPRKPAAGLGLVKLGTAKYRESSVEAVEIQSDPHVFLPAWIARPKRSAPALGTVLLLDSRGRQQWREGEWLEQLAASGRVACAADLRGFGDLTPAISPGAPRYALNHATEQHYAWSSLILGEPLLAQRVTDILCLVEALSSPVVIAARGLVTTPALFAACFDQRIRGILLSGGLLSFRDIVQSPDFAAGGYFIPVEKMHLDVFGSFVPGMLKHMDLPAVAASIAPRPVVLEAPRDASGAAASPEKIDVFYGGVANVQVTAQQRSTLELLKELLANVAWR